MADQQSSLSLTDRLTEVRRLFTLAESADAAARLWREQGNARLNEINAESRSAAVQRKIAKAATHTPSEPEAKSKYVPPTVEAMIELGKQKGGADRDALQAAAKLDHRPYPSWIKQQAQKRGLEVRELAGPNDRTHYQFV